jgi:hypothetical protein
MARIGVELNQEYFDAVKRRLAAERPPATGCDGGHPGCSVCDAADARAEQPPKLRVFTFEGVAYQVDALARFAMTPIGIARIEGRVGLPWKLRVTGATAHYPATRLSLENEWFDITLRGAAHAYLDAYLDAFRVYMSCVDTATGETGPTAHSLEFGFSQVCRSFYRGELVDSLCDSAPTSYSARVRADIEARLRGEAGEVPKP